MRQELLERSERWRRSQSRTLPRPLVEREDFKRLARARQLQIGFDLQKLEAIAGEIDAWFLCSKEEQEAELGLAMFLGSLEAKIEVTQEHKNIEAEGENFSWWIFRNEWHPDILYEQSLATIIPQTLTEKLNEPPFRIGDTLEAFLVWLRRQNSHLCGALDALYDAKDYETVYVYICASFIFLWTIYLGLRRAMLSGHYGLAQREQGASSG